MVNEWLLMTYNLVVYPKCFIENLKISDLIFSSILAVLYATVPVTAVVWEKVMINTYFKLYLNNWQLFYVATDLVTVLAFEVKCSLCFSFFVLVWVFVDVFTVNDFLYFIFQQIYCLNILRMPFKIKRKKVKCLSYKCKAV